MQSPHYRRVSAQPTHKRVLICYKNFAAFNPQISHIGLGVSAQNTAKVLVAHNVDAFVRPVRNAQDILDALKKLEATHVVISAPWLSAPDLVTLINQVPDVQFSVNCHSNVGFLQADARGVDLLRQYIDVEQGSTNFAISANSEKGALWLRTAYRCPCEYLPNLYYLDYSAASHRRLWNGGILRIGAFGATRPLKNLMSAAGAALVLANDLRADVEFHVSSGRTEGGGNTIIRAIQAMLANLPNIKLVQDGWQSWSQFRDIVRSMHVLMSVSYTESFNMVTADGVAEGVPSVVSDAIDWAPNYWVAAADQTNEIARIARQLVVDPNAARDGYIALENHNSDGFNAWCQYMGIDLRYSSMLRDPHGLT